MVDFLMWCLEGGNEFDSFQVGLDIWVCRTLSTTTTILFLQKSPSELMSHDKKWATHTPCLATCTCTHCTLYVLDSQWTGMLQALLKHLQYIQVHVQCTYRPCKFPITSKGHCSLTDISAQTSICTVYVHVCSNLPLPFYFFFHHYTFHLSGRHSRIDPYLICTEDDVMLTCGRQSGGGPFIDHFN